MNTHAAAAVYSGRAGASAALAGALNGGPPPGTAWYSMGELARAEPAASGPAAAALARAGSSPRSYSMLSRTPK